MNAPATNREMIDTVRDRQGETLQTLWQMYRSERDERKRSHMHLVMVGLVEAITESAKR